MGTPEAGAFFQLASSGRRPQEEYGIRVDNSNKPFEHVWLQTSEDEKLSVMDFVNKTVSDAEPVKPPPVESTSLKVVQDEKDLKELVAKLCGANEFAVNLKSNQYRSFQGFTCLMQISTRTEDFIVDTLKLRVKIGPYLRELFKDPTKRKVMHGADRCIIWLQRDFGIYVCNMFDTGQASKVLKFEGNSLEFLLRHFCKVATHKEYENADWRLRPLPDEMLRYAREETHYLLFLYDLMQRRLFPKTSDPVCTEAPPLVEVYQRGSDICMQLYQKDILTENSYLNIYGLHAADLNGQQLAIVAGLYMWRDATAREVDESTCYILPDKVLIEIAKKMPVTTLELCHLLKSRHPYIVRNLGPVVTIITNSMQNAVAFEPVAKKLKEEHFDMMDAKNVTLANLQEPTEVAGSERASNAVEDNSFKEEVGANQNHKLARPQEKYNIRVDNYQPFEHVWLQISEDGSRLIHPLEKFSVLDFPDKVVSDVEPVKPSPVETTPFKLVQDVKDLKELATKLRDTDEFSVALKHNQHRSFQGLTCLMQISTRTEDFIVDAFKLRVQIGPYLQQVFKDPTKRKVMHEADRCILWLQRDFGIYVCNMFDTRQASKVLKLEGDSLEYLLRHFCAIAANKEYKNADWRLRPLTDAMLRYAREDTHYLLFIYDHMRRRLLSSPTDPECPEAPPLIEVYQRSYNICRQLYQKEILTENSYLNIYGLRTADLSGQQLAIVAGLCELRYHIAREVDESTCYILPDKVLIEIAKQMPLTTLKLCHILKQRHTYIERNLGFVVSIIMNSAQNAAVFEPAAKKLKEEHIGMIATRNVKFANVEEAAKVAGSESTSNAVEDDTFEKKVGNFIVGANQDHKLEGSSATEKIKVEQIKPSVSLSFHSSTDKTEPSHAVVKESPTAQEIQVLPLASEPKADIIMLEVGSDVEEAEEKPANDEGGEQKMEDENNVMLLDSDCCAEEKDENHGTMLLSDLSSSFHKCEENTNKRRKSDVEGGSGGLVKVTPFDYAPARKEARFGENGSDGEDGDGSKNQCKGERKKTGGGGRKDSAGARNAKLTDGEEAASDAGIESTSNAVTDDSVEKEVGNFIVGANQSQKFDGSSASRVSIEVQKKPSCAFGAMFGHEAGKRKHNLDSKAAEEVKVEHKYSVSLTSHSFTDRTEPSREYDGAIAPDKEARTYHTIKIPVGDRHIIVETGEIAKQASGSVNLKVGGTTICTTVCISDVPSKPSDLFPMSVHHQERLSASGYTSGGYHKREGRLKDHEVLVCRRIDRALRPTMRKGFCHETQIVSLVLSYDGLHSPDSLAITAAGIAVALSEVPNTNTVAGVRIGLIGDKFVVNPTTVEMKESKLDLLLAGSEAGITMIEGDCDLLPEEKLLQAMEVGMDAVRAICKEVDNLVKMCGKHKLLGSIKLPPPELYKRVEEIAVDELVRVLQIEDKIPRGKALSSLESKVLSILTKVEEFDEGNVHIKPVPTFYSEVDVKLMFKSVCSIYLRKQMVKGGKRSDGRTSKEIRSIASKCGSLSETHGSALFTRGETQAMTVVTLGDKRMAQRIETLAGVEEVKSFYLQYIFWPSSVGRVGKIGAPSRREIGHGTLAERALKPILPSEDDFPYTIRVESNITESNGSSSMASVCGGCLALQDAGVPLKSFIAGIAMGMVLDTKEFGGDGMPLILSDITGSEDASGDMDFKVAGNDDGVTAFQMDIKVGGITMSIIKQVLLQAKEGRKHILDEMLKCSPPPSKKLAKHAPLIRVMKVEPDKVNLIIGFGGRKVKRIIQQTGVEYIDTQDIGTVKITSRDLASLEKAKDIISNLITVPVVGAVYRNCKVTAVVRFGVFVEVAPGVVGLCHVSELSLDQLSNPNEAFKVGDIVDVKVIKVNEKGPCLSRKALLPDQGTDKPNKNPCTAGGSNDSCRSGC